MYTGKKLFKACYCHYSTTSVNIFRKHQPANEGKRSRKEELFGLFMQAVLENYKQERSVALLCRQTLCHSQISFLISKEVSGQPAGNWIDEYVILEAKNVIEVKPDEHTRK